MYQVVTEHVCENIVYKGFSWYFEGGRIGRIWYRWQMAVILARGYDGLFAPIFDKNYK